MVVNLRADRAPRQTAKHVHRYRVLFNGRDVTPTLSVFYADGRRGVLGVYLRDDSGHLHLNAQGDIAREFRRGRVRLVRRGTA